MFEREFGSIFSSYWKSKFYIPVMIFALCLWVLIVYLMLDLLGYFLFLLEKFTYVPKKNAFQ